MYKPRSSGLNTKMWNNKNIGMGQVIWNIYIYIYSFIHSVFCLTTGPTPLPKRILHIVRSRASSFKWEYPLLSIRSSNSFLRLLPRLLVTSSSPFIFPSITCFRKQFRRNIYIYIYIYIILREELIASYTFTLQLQTDVFLCLFISEGFS
jgi:hypothetical protein